MVPLNESQRTALTAIMSLWPDVEVILVGAMALGCHVPMDHRATYDLDLAVSLPIDEFPGPLATLEGWNPHPKMAHRFFSPDGQQVDIVPAGPTLLQQGYVDWDDARMSLIGFDLAFAHNSVEPIDENEAVRVASAPAIAVMKMRSWLDRPYERAKDLQDLVHLLRNYVSAGDDRRWTDDIIALGLDYDDVSPYLVGRDIARIIDERHRPHVHEFIATVTPAQLTAASTWHDTTPAEQALRSLERGLDH